MNEIEKLALEFYEHDMVKFGKFTLKSGKISDHYFDLRSMVSAPKLLQQICALIKSRIFSEHLRIDRICGLAYSAIPLASVLSYMTGIPLIYVRKERKEHGTGNLIEGVFNRGDRCLLIDDVLTTGGSLKEVGDILESHDLVVDSAIVLVDRSPKPVDIGITVRHLMSDQTIFNAIDRYIHPLYKKLKMIMQEKKTRLVVSADVTTKEELFNLIKIVGPHICVLKTHIDIMTNFDHDVIITLRAMADTYNFLILEDRKFADIGNTVKLQLTSGIYKIAEWADLVTVHGVSGEGVIENIRNATKGKMGVLLLAQMSNTGNLIDEKYTAKVVDIANRNRDMVVGYICQDHVDIGFLHFTPGVNLEKEADATDQRYRTPKIAIGDQGCDLIIVGRGIYEAQDPEATAIAYKRESWIPSFVKSRL